MLPLLYFDYPLEQGLRRVLPVSNLFNSSYFDYPLEQGLRQRTDKITFK